MKITKDMIKPKTVFHCSTEEKAEELCKKLHNLGYIWGSGKSYLGNTQHEHFGENTCYCPYHNAYDDINYFKIKKYKIIEYELDEYELEKYELEKANKRIVELEAAIKHLQGSNGNKKNRIKNLEKKLEENKSIDDVIDYDQLIKSNKRLIEFNKKDNNEYLECICEQLKCALTGKIYYTSEFLEILEVVDNEKDRQLMKRVYFKEWCKRNGGTNK